jgi:hypothetical protein
MDAGNPKFYRILDEMKELYNKKNQQYATHNDTEGNFKRTAILANKLLKDSIKNRPLAMDLLFMAKQIDGVYEIVGEGKEGTVDSLKDKLMDIAVYSIISMILIEDYETDSLNIEKKK